MHRDYIGGGWSTEPAPDGRIRIIPPDPPRSVMRDFWRTCSRGHAESIGRWGLEDLLERLGFDVTVPQARAAFRVCRTSDLPDEFAVDAFGGALQAIQYANRQRNRASKNRRALALLREFLTDEQREQLRRSRWFSVMGPSGTEYRLIPSVGNTQAIERHGSKVYVTAFFCLHPDRDKHPVPPADTTLGHLLMLRSGMEEHFLATANMTPTRRAGEALNRGWDGEWQRTRHQLRTDPERRAAHEAGLEEARVRLREGAVEREAANREYLARMAVEQAAYRAGVAVR
jgi:hypothetical protein